MKDLERGLLGKLVSREICIKVATSISSAGSQNVPEALIWG